MEEISKSKKKRIEREAQLEKEKRQAKISKALWIVIPSVIAALLITLIVYNAVRIPDTFVATTDFGRYIRPDGTLKIDSAKYVPEDFKPEDIVVDKNKVEYTKEDADRAIESEQEENKELIEDTSYEVKDGDEIQLDYTGSIDGTEFDGGTAEDSSLLLGSGQFIPGFEDQLIGKKVGEDVTVNVTFPEDYGKEELNGKDAVFECHIDGYYKKAELTEDFITEHSDGNAKTKEEWEEYLVKTEYAKNVKTAVDEWIYNEAKIAEYPARYLHYMQEYVMFQDQASYQQTLETYQMYGLDIPYKTYEEYLEQTYEDYDAHRLEEAQKTIAANMYYDKIARDAGLKATEDDYEAFKLEYGITDEVEEFYGKNFLMQQTLHNVTAEWLADKVTVAEIAEEEPEETEPVQETTEEKITEDTETPGIEEEIPDNTEEEPAVEEEIEEAKTTEPESIIEETPDAGSETAGN